MHRTKPASDQRREDVEKCLEHVLRETPQSIITVVLVPLTLTFTVPSADPVTTFAPSCMYTAVFT